MAQVSKITPTGTLYTAGSIDEVTYNSTSTVKKNLFSYSKDLTNAYWVNYNETASLTNATLAPDGTNTAFLVTSTGAYPNTRPSQNLTVTPNTYYTLSGYVKYGNTAVCTLANESGNGPVAVASFDLTSGTNTALAYNASNPVIQNVGNGWWRVSVTIYNDVYTYMDPEPFRIGSYSGQSAGEFMYCWGPQLEVGQLATVYVPTGANAIPTPTFAARTDSGGNTYITNTFDEVTYNSTSGVVVNLATYSQNFTNSVWNNITRASIVGTTFLAPDGTQTASKIADNVGVSTGYLRRYYPVKSGTTYTYSVYAKAGEWSNAWVSTFTDNAAFAGDYVNFNLVTGTLATNSAPSRMLNPTIVNAGNGWYRISVTVVVQKMTVEATGGIISVGPTNDAFGGGGTTGNGSSGIYIWGVQVEQGSIATMYVPTLATTAPVPTFAQRTEVSGNVYVKGIYDEVTGILPVTSGLTLNFDPSYAQSYSGTGTTMYDISGNTATATWSSSTVGFVSNFQASPTEYLQFYGNGAVTTNYVQPATTSADSFTWNVWFRATQNGYGEIIIGNRIPYVTSSLDFCKLTTLAWEFYPTFLSVTAPLNVWQNVTLVKNGTTLSYYRNAALITTNTTSASKVANPFYIGGDSNAGEISTARIGQVQVYNRALTLAEISQVFNTFRIRYGI